MKHLHGVHSASFSPLPNQTLLTQRVAQTLQNETIQTRSRPGDAVMGKALCQQRSFGGKGWKGLLTAPVWLAPLWALYLDFFDPSSSSC